MIRKAVIPAAGLGTRMLPITKAQPKEMLPVVNKPVIQYVVEEAYYSGIKEILIITGKGKRAIEDHFDRASLPVKDEEMEKLERMLDEISIFYVRQKEPKGLGDAVKYAKSFVNDEPFALMLGDNITIPPCIKELMNLFERYKAPIVALEKLPKERISQHGIIDGEEIACGIYKIKDLIEKPKIEEAPSNIGIIGRYILTTDIFDYLEKLKLGFGGEIQLTDALKKMSKEKDVYGMLFMGKRYDIGDKVEWLKANIEIALVSKDFKMLREWLKEKSYAGK
ncbi:MAG: UTP--glucose-1-phosphate uridylyltransferase GalU [Candidatus Aenigmatarchaeota archaeon]